MTETLVAPSPWPPAPRRRQWVVPVLAGAVALLLAVATALVLSRSNGDEPTVVAKTTAAKPAAVPTGSRGEEWYQFYGAEPWAARVTAVDDVGMLLIIQTDLKSSETETALDICRAGREHVARLGVAARALVSVYGRTSALLVEGYPTGCRLAA